MAHKQAFTQSAAIWKILSEEDKYPFVEKSMADQQRYQKQLEDLETKGYFMTVDGKKSTDLYVDPKKKYGPRCVVPKKPLTAYMCFASKNVNLFRKE